MKGRRSCSGRKRLLMEETSPDRQMGSGNHGVRRFPRTIRAFFARYRRIGNRRTPLHQCAGKHGIFDHRRSPKRYVPFCHAARPSRESGTRIGPLTGDVATVHSYARIIRNGRVTHHNAPCGPFTHGGHNPACPRIDKVRCECPT